jgi:hypothetical protein
MVAVHDGLHGGCQKETAIFIYSWFAEAAISLNLLMLAATVPPTQEAPYSGHSHMTTLHTGGKTFSVKRHRPTQQITRNKQQVTNHYSMYKHFSLMGVFSLTSGKCLHVNSPQY